MTIKTEILLRSETKNINKISDMQKRGAVRNLFGPPDQSELQRQFKEQQDEQNKRLETYKLDSVIGIIMLNPKDQVKRLKRNQPAVQSDSESDVDSDSTPSILPILSKNTQNEQGEASSSSSSSSASSSTENLSSSNSANTEDNNFKNGSPRILVRGQRTIKSKNQKWK
jgi:hypothetical protein